MEDGQRKTDGSVAANARDGDAEPAFAPAAAAANSTNTVDDSETAESNGKTIKGGQEGDGDGGDDGDGDNTLWEQMTAREGRDAARRAGMSVGDWQAERQLQEALRESEQETGANGGAAASGNMGDGGEERSFIDAGFHALGTSAVEGEEGQEERRPTHRPTKGQQQQSPHNAGNAAGGSSSSSSSHNQSAMMYSVDAAAAAAAAASSGRIHTVSSVGGEGSSSAAGRQGGDAGGEEDVEEDEEGFGDVELVVTQDGGIIPVSAAEAETAAAAAATTTTAVGFASPFVGSAESLESEAPMVQKSGRKARKSGVGGRVEGKDGGAAAAAAGGGGGGRASAAAGHARKGAPGEGAGGEGAGGQAVEQGEFAEGEEEEEEEEAPLPPDIVLTLADDVLHRVMLFLNPEEILECRAVNSRWEFPSHEAVFEGLCRRTYLAQSAKKLLNVDRWRSWQRMFKLRPRLRDTGLYTLKTTYYKKPVRDMSTEWTPGKILKVTYYRYFRFFGDGRVAYGLVHESPKEFVRMLQEGSPKVVYGTYTIRKWEVSVEIPNPWSWVHFTLQLANGERGRFTHLVMLRHSSVPRNDARVGRCHHTVKSSDFFTFRRVWQF
eukprot:g9335.t1